MRVRDHCDDHLGAAPSNVRKAVSVPRRGSSAGLTTPATIRIYRFGYRLTLDLKRSRDCRSGEKRHLKSVRRLPCGVQSPHLAELNMFSKKVFEPGQKVVWRRNGVCPRIDRMPRPMLANDVTSVTGNS